MMILGVDPGERGAIALLSPRPDGPALVDLFRLPTRAAFDGKKVLDGDALADRLAFRYAADGQGIVFLERAKGYTGDASGSAFTYGRSFGALEHALHREARDWMILPVEPQTWQEATFVVPRIKGESRADRRKRIKAASVAAALARFRDADLIPPRCRTPHDGLADALNLAAYGHDLYLSRRKSA